MNRGSQSSAHVVRHSDTQSNKGADDALSERPKPGSTLAIAAVLAAMVLVVLDGAIANIALPTIAQSLDVPSAMSVWVITAYQTALLIALLPCAALGESRGYRRVFAGGVALFTAASVFCSMSPSLPWLVAARFVQGLGGAAVMALGVALLRAVVPDHRLGVAIGWNALAVALASALGPALGAAALWSLKGNPLPLVPFTMLCGLGFSLFNVANNRNIFISVPQERSGAAGGMQGSARLIGQTAGAVTMTLLFTLGSDVTAPLMGLGIGAALTLLAGLVSMVRK
jgi:MFS family permease